MNKLTILLLFAFLLTACESNSPEHVFDVAVLNTNMIFGFAGDGLQRELESPSVKLVEGSTDKTEPMTRKEIIESKIQFIDANLEKVKDITPSTDTKQMLEASVALHEYVLAVYRKEYMQLAALYDSNAPSSETEAAAKNISEKYYPGFEKLDNDLIAAGKVFAANNNIKVNWDVNTSPH